jgi:hypothetical protein
VLRRTFKTSEAVGNRRAYKTAGRRDSRPVLLSEYYQDDRIKNNEMGGAFGTRI